VLIISGDHIYKMNYDLMLQRHKEVKADVSIAVIEIPIEESYRFGMMKVDQDDWITEFQEKPKVTTSNTASMGVYIFNWKLLKQYLIADEEKPHTNSDFGQDIIPAMLADNQRLYAYRYKGYWKDVGTIDSLWEAHMDLLADDKPFRLHDPKWRIFTKNPNQPPQYIGASARINRSLVNEGCMVFGEIEHSVLFYGVDVGEGSVIKDSIVMPQSKIGKNVTIHRAIIGWNTVIEDNAQVGNPDESSDITLIGDNMVITAK
jgi:glucose-1-phosphate adenylyltransferase